MADLIDRPQTDRRPGELGPRELARWSWRQLTSMRTALVLLLLLALAAVPGSVIPQEGVDALAVSQWKADHPGLTPVYERLGLFSVYDSAWFSAIYLLLMVSLIGCIIPRTFHYVRAIRALPPLAPRNLSRLPDHASYSTDLSVDEVLDRARVVLGSRRYRLRLGQQGAVSAEKGYLREVGNLVFHLSVIVVLVGFGIGSVFGYQGGVIVVVDGPPFSNTAASYDDLDPGSGFGADDLDPFSFTVDDFDITWLTKGSGAGTAREFKAALSYREGVDGEEKTYDLRVNHPLTIGDTDLFLIGHGYAPIITVKDGEGSVVSSGPVVFLPQDPSFLSFGVVKAPSARPTAIGLEGVLYPTFARAEGDDPDVPTPVTVFPALGNPLISMNVWSGDLGLDDGVPRSVYLLDTSKATPVQEGGKQLRLDLSLGETQQLPDGLGSVSFDGVQPWVRIQVSQSPGKEYALAGVVLALIGLIGSLFLRPRRVWVRARRRKGDDGDGDGDDEGGTMVEVALLDRSGGADLTEVLDVIVAELQEVPTSQLSKERK
ncbi:cytochrome c biogenesis protein ResB [Nocardioides sp.]|uniref:cytochrome c biogenesis protein ResB n=1 Tax=Nocardioides sp. TaxID=35761 RepID=UPI00272616C4|nr:cytochrome c biogenesis protein ResB [Nocardioides sp.]MDO9455488.1 cytochrome c biogenesis protein ResB [Nocardioides sp.]